MRYYMTKPRFAAVLCCFSIIVSAPVSAQRIQVRQITDHAGHGPAIELVEIRRIGRLEGTNDAFGRIVDVRADSRGRIFVADDLNHRVGVFSPAGMFIQNLGRRGQGPGEFESPWAIGIDARDSVFVWDMTQARISVFGPDLVFRRSFRIGPQWLINSINFLRNDDLVVAAFATGEQHGIHVLTRDGAIRRSFAPVTGGRAFAGFESSVLGGTLDVDGEMIVYSRKSPYEVLFYDSGGRLRTHCRGSGQMTTQPGDVVKREALSAELNWKRFVHSASIVALGRGMFINTIVDPTTNSRVVDLLRSDCTLIRRTRLNAPVTIVGRSGRQAIAVSNIEYPEIIVYELHMRNRR